MNMDIKFFSYSEQAPKMWQLRSMENIREKFYFCLFAYLLICFNVLEALNSFTTCPLPKRREKITTGQYIKLCWILLDHVQEVKHIIFYF